MAKQTKKDPPEKKPPRLSKNGKLLGKQPGTNWYSDEEIIESLEKTGGLVALAAKRLGCCDVTIYNRARANPKIKEVIKAQRRLLVDTAEQKLREAVEKHKAPWAISMVLKTLGRKRGYVERQEFRHGGDKNAPPIQTLQGVVNIDSLNLPLEVRAQLLQAILEQEKKQELLNAEAVHEQKEPRFGDLTPE